MIRNRLKELMAERNLKASRVANDIDNLSRNTINTTVNNNGKMIQLETINSLCQYLGVAPADFFEYLPFDVIISINSDKDFKINKPNLDDELLFGATIEPFYLNLYLKKRNTNQASGTTSKTFELSVILEKPLKFSVDSNDINKLVPANKAEFVVVIGNPPQKRNFANQYNDFIKFWNEELTEGFRQDIRHKIIVETTNYVKNEIQDKTNMVYWDNFSGIVNFRFDEAFSDETNVLDGPIMNIEFDKLPF